MIKLEIAGKKYKVNFRYTFQEKKVTENITKTWRDFERTYTETVARVKTKRIYSDTMCTIRDENNNIVSEGYAFLHDLDKFDKKRGRKLAFERAISVLFGVAERRNAMFQFFDQCNIT